MGFENSISSSMSSSALGVTWFLLRNFVENNELNMLFKLKFENLHLLSHQYNPFDDAIQ